MLFDADAAAYTRHTYTQYCRFHAAARFRLLRY